MVQFYTYGALHNINRQIFCDIKIKDSCRRLGFCQQLALLPVDPSAAVHQPYGASTSLCPPARPLTTLAPGPQNRRRSEKHRPRHLVRQQLAQVGLLHQ